MSDTVNTPAVRSHVFCSYYDSTNKIVQTLGTVLAINTLDKDGIAENGAPSLTVLVVNPVGTDSKLGGIKWPDEFTRLTGVRHHSHSAHDTGLTQSAWLELPPDALEDAPAILPDRNPTPANPIFERQEDSFHERVMDHAMAVQSGKLPAGQTASPLVHEDAAGPVAVEKEVPVTTEASTSAATGETLTEAPASEPAAPETPETKPDTSQETAAQQEGKEPAPTV